MYQQCINNQRHVFAIIIACPMFVLYNILSLILGVSGKFFIPLQLGETVRVWCQGHDIEFGNCKIRGGTSCHRDFAYADSNLPLSLSCSAKSREGRETVTLSVEIVRQVFKSVAVEINDEVGRLSCLNESPVSTLRDDPRETYPIMWWASDARGSGATGNILDSEYIKQRFWNLELYAVKPGDVVDCNGTRFSHEDLNKVFTTPPFYWTLIGKTAVKPTVPPTVPPNNGSTNETSVDSGLPKNSGLSRTTLFLVLVAGGVVFLSCVVCAFVWLCWRRRFSQPRIEPLPVQPGNEYQSPDQCSDVHYEDIDLKNSPGYETDLRLTPSPRLCSETQNIRFLTQESSCPISPYSYARVQRAPLPPPIQLHPPTLLQTSPSLPGYSQLHDPLPDPLSSSQRYNTIPSRDGEVDTRQDDGRRYNRLARDGAEDVTLQYNVLIR